MKHLTILKWLNVASAALLLVGTLLTVGSMVATYAFLVSADERAAVAAAPMALFTGLVVLVLGAMFVFCAIAAWGVEKGRARASQTILAVASVTSFPFGTAYGLYALWVCWWNEETRATFQTSLGRDITVTALGLLVFALPFVPMVGLSIPPLIPTNLARLDAEYAAFDDTSQRIERDGCGLTEVAPGCTPAAPTGVETEPVKFPTRTQAMGFSELKGTLHVPRGLTGPRPGVVLVHGSGPTDRDAAAPGELVATYSEAIPLFEILADHLANQGLVVLRYDKRACPGCYPVEHHKGDYSEFRFQHFVDDAHAAADFLASRPEVDGRALIVIGHSQGGGFAPHIAAADDRFVAAVMLAGISGTFREALLDQLARFGDIRKAQFDYLSAWAVDAQLAILGSCLDKLDGEYDPTDPCMGGGVQLQAVAEYEELNRTTRDVIGRLDVPLLALSGTVDRNVPPTELLAIQEAAAGRDAEFHLIGGVGHGLQNLVEPTDPPSVDQRVLEVLDAFLASVKRSPEP